MGWNSVATLTLGGAGGGSGAAGTAGPAGPPGQRGATWFSGTFPPDPAVGLAGDLYLQANGQVWKKVGIWPMPTSWVKFTNITGPAGPAGPAGQPGAAGPAGQTGAGQPLSTWPLYYFNKPNMSMFSWQNQGGATAVNTKDGVLLTAPASTTDNWRILTMTAPPTPYTITTAHIVNFGGVTANASFQYASLLFWASASGKFQSFDTFKGNSGATGQAQLEVTNWTNVTTFSAVAQGFGNASNQCFFFLGPVIWQRITDDGTNRIFYTSADGVGWVQMYSTTRTTFITADTIGWGANAQNPTYNMTMTLLHWQQS